MILYVYTVTQQTSFLWESQPWKFLSNIQGLGSHVQEFWVISFNEFDLKYLSPDICVGRTVLARTDPKICSGFAKNIQKIYLLSTAYKHEICSVEVFSSSFSSYLNVFLCLMCDLWSDTWGKSRKKLVTIWKIVRSRRLEPLFYSQLDSWLRDIYQEFIFWFLSINSGPLLNQMTPEEMYKFPRSILTAIQV